MSKDVLLLIDIQKEYNTETRPFYIEGIEYSLKNAKKLLENARENNWEVIHVKHIQNGSMFSNDSEYSDYIDGFSPRKNEREFIKNNFSCFSNPQFSEILQKLVDSNIMIIGYGSTMCVLSTIIEGYHRGNKITFVHDASNAKADANKSELEIHSVMTSVLSRFAKIISADDILS